MFSMGQDEIELSMKDISPSFLNSKVISAEISGHQIFFSSMKKHPNYLVIIPQKGKYNNIKSLNIPEGISINGQNFTIVAIAHKAFYKARKLKELSLPKTIKVIGNEAFKGVDIEKINFSEGLEKIGDRAFMKNDLADIILPEGLLEIGEEAFYCLKPTIFSREYGGSLYIPKSVFYIGDHAFSMTRNGYGAWFHSKRKLLCIPDIVTLEDCKKQGISKSVVENYLSGK